MAKRISFNPLNDESFKAAIAELRKYQAWVTQKEAELREKLAEIGREVASVKFSQAAYDGINDVKVRVDSTGSVAVIYAEGKAVAFIEFGAGAKYGYGHPMNGELGVGPGTYPDGKGHWDDPDGWYYAHGKKSWGNPPAQAMVAARDKMVEQLTTIAKEVFGDNG